MIHLIGYDASEGQAHPRILAVSESNPLPVTGEFSPAPPQPVVPSGTTKTTFVRGVKAVAASGTPEALAAPGTYVTNVTLFGMRAARTPNTGNVWIDSVSPNDAQQIQLAPGDAGAPNGASYYLQAPPGRVIDLGDIYVDVETNGDGVFYFGML